MEILWLAFLVIALGAFAMLVGAGRTRDDARGRGRWDSAFYAESHRETNTDATGVLMCRSCGANAPERAGRCPSCGALL